MNFLETIQSEKSKQQNNSKYAIFIKLENKQN